MDTERWLPATFHPELEVSDEGNVRYAETHELLTLRKGSDNFIYADLDLPVHYLVAGTWQPYPTGKPLEEGRFRVEHVDGDTTNNHYYNLIAYPTL